MSERRLQVYETREVRVTFDPQICVHSGVCLSALPEVFNVSRRRWIDPGKASPSEVIAAVARCPSGALQATLVTAVHPAASQAAAAPVAKQPAVTVTVRDKASLLIEGPFKVVDANGTVLREGVKCTLCRCGHSASKPFCDGSHQRYDDWYRND